MNIKLIVSDLDNPYIEYDWNLFISYISNNLNFKKTDISNIFFNQNYYFLQIGKFEFKNYIIQTFKQCEMIFNDDIPIDFEEIKKVYNKGLKYNKNKVDSIVNYGKKHDIDIAFMGNIDKIHFKYLTSLDPRFSQSSFFTSSFLINSAKPDENFFHAIKYKYHKKYDSNQILIIDNNIENLLVAKSFGFITLYYNGEYDLTKQLSKIF